MYVLKYIYGVSKKIIIMGHYLNKPLHGYYERSCNNVWGGDMSSYWLAKGDLSIESEGFLVAAREQALSTNAIIHLHSHNVSPLCRLKLCADHPETVEHLISGCSQLASHQYEIRHDHVAHYIHWLLCKV